MLVAIWMGRTRLWITTLLMYKFCILFSINLFLLTMKLFCDYLQRHEIGNYQIIYGLNLFARTLNEMTYFNAQVLLQHHYVVYSRRNKLKFHKIWFVFENRLWLNKQEELKPLNTCIIFSSNLIHIEKAGEKEIPYKDNPFHSGLNQWNCWIPFTNLSEC